MDDHARRQRVFHLLAAARQLHRGQLLLVVPLKGRPERRQDIGAVRRKGFDVWIEVIVSAKSSNAGEITSGGVRGAGRRAEG